MAGKVVDLIDTNWGIDDTRTVIAKSDDIGKGRDLATYDYVEVSLTSPFSKEYADLFMSTQNIDSAVFVELKANTEARRDDMFEELERIMENHRKRPDTPGDYDRIVWEDITPLDDEAFGAYVHEVAIGFVARSRDV
jgi:hypothetical protein